jgi:lipoate-protein ligase A
VDAGTELFANLGLWIDPAPRDGPEQMACDETLMAEAGRPVLRVFRWRRPWISAGYFSDMDAAARVRPDLPLCRRWTGGGIVVHEGDFTFALVVPRGEKLALERPPESYRFIHLALVEALRVLGISSALAAEEPPADAECFARAVQHDVVAQGRKVAGGAQRRTRDGLLHQGSVQGLGNDSNELASALARALSPSVALWVPPEGFEKRALALTGQKYASGQFLRGRQPGDFTGGHRLVNDPRPFSGART